MNCRSCRICQEWIALYEEEKERRQIAELEANIQKDIRRTQKESFDNRLNQMSKALDTLKERVQYLERQLELSQSDLVALLGACPKGGEIVREEERTCTEWERPATDDCVELLAKALGGGTTSGCQGRIAAPNEPIPKEWMII